MRRLPYRAAPLLKANSRSERFLFWLSNRIPLKLVYYCVVRACAMTMTAEDDGTELRAYQIIERMRRLLNA